MTPVPCSKCGRRPRAAGQRWCRECRADYKRQARRSQAQETPVPAGDHGEHRPEPRVSVSPETGKILDEIAAEKARLELREVRRRHAELDAAERVARAKEREDRTRREQEAARQAAEAVARRKLEVRERTMAELDQLEALAETTGDERLRRYCRDMKLSLLYEELLC